ncbi:MAG: hypothetical protein ACLUIB_14605 [Faecalibacillus intestinalis]
MIAGYLPAGLCLYVNDSLTAAQLCMCLILSLRYGTIDAFTNIY